MTAGELIGLLERHDPTRVILLEVGGDGAVHTGLPRSVEDRDYGMSNALYISTEAP